MAREHANLRLDIWTDQSWRDLPRDEQWLYTLLLSHASLNYAGVADWRPGRLAPMAAQTTREEVESFGAQLQNKRFILIDEGTEEVLIRTFLKYDNILKQPKLSVSMVNAYGGVASEPIRKVIIHELQKVSEKNPDWKGLAHPRVVALMDQPAAPIEEFTQGFTPEVTPPLTPSFTPGLTPNAAQAQGLRTSTSTATPSNEGGVGETTQPKRRKPKVPLPADLTIRDSHKSKATKNHIDVEWQFQKFKNHHESKDSRFADWSKAFHTWLDNAAEYQNGKNGTPSPVKSVWDYTEDDYRKAEEQLERRHNQRQANNLPF